MKRLLKELIHLQKERNSLLASINETLKTIASKETSENFKQYQKNVGQSSF